MANMVENASLTASGFENGLRIEARKILKSPKKSKGFSSAELKALKDLEQGSGAQNAAKFLGRFGISEGKATSMLGAAVSGTIGNQLGGAAGALGLPALGQIAKNTAQRLTSNKAKFADQLIRAGGDARAVVRAYLKNTPKRLHNLEDITQLLLDPNITPESIAKISSRVKIVEDAKFLAERIKKQAQLRASQAAIAAPLADEDDNG
jgi:HPt (histidine-containing phosphotransfer) domain-containing protein